MSKYQYSEEFEVNASAKAIYEYLTNPNYLSQWFDADVSTNEEEIYDFVWDDTSHLAKIISHRHNRQVKYEFLDENAERQEDPAYIDFRIEENDMTGSTFIHVTDYSEMNSEDDLKDLWTGLIAQLREVMGS